ncbi:MAG TPA: DUF2058 family protein [Arenimonas sp.]|nr:DUF2058 family protein [Arenimonas sp.]
MSGSLRDQLLGLGFQPPAKPDKPAKPAKPRHAGAPARGGAKPQQASRRSPREREEMDLAKAYAIRAQREKDERIEAERQKQEAARQKREAKAKVVDLMAGKALNLEGAEIARHFEYGGKIRRIYVTAEQLTALNAGELAVVQLDGRYLLVSLELATAVEGLLPSLLALRVDPSVPVVSDPYDDPKYQVPDDLVW